MLCQKTHISRHKMRNVTLSRIIKIFAKKWSSSFHNGWNICEEKRGTFHSSEWLKYFQRKRGTFLSPEWLKSLHKKKRWTFLSPEWLKSLQRKTRNVPLCRMTEILTQKKGRSSLQNGWKLCKEKRRMLFLQIQLSRRFCFLGNLHV